MGKLAAKAVKMVAEGGLGKGPARAYWWLAGKKTWTGLVLATAYFGLEYAHVAGLCPACDTYAAWVLTASLALVSVGLLDGAVREAPPVRPPVVDGPPRP